MAQGYTGTMLYVDLGTSEVHEKKRDDAFYRTYLGGGAMGSCNILEEKAGRADALGPDNVLTIAPGVTTAAPVSGVSRCCVTALSPITGAVGESQAGGNLGPYLKRAGYDALVIKGRAKAPCYLYVEGGRVEIRSAEDIWGLPTTEALSRLHEDLGESRLSVLQCGPAGERKVRFASLAADRFDNAGRTGMGAVFGSKNLKAVVVRPTGEVSFANPEGLKALNRKAAERLPTSGFPTILRKHGTPGVVGNQARAGNLATRNYSRGFHSDHMSLDGSTFDAKLGAGETTCFGCVVRCRKKVAAEEPYPLTDKLGGPEFETLGLLGSNLEITDAAAVARASQLCGEYGLDTITMGGIAAYVFECVERGLIPKDELELKNVGFGDVEGLFWLIEKVARREGIGQVLADGFIPAIQKYGHETARFAIHVKNQGLAVHMAQVKPSQALMYAVCPIGPDHQSSEHDWLMLSQGEDRKGLAILGEGTAASMDIDKVRMTIYSQYYYSLLDSLCLCMFCWGPGNLFGYRDLEELLSCTTGWEATFWELMKAGERRVNLMRQINAQRGFTRAQDRLPMRLSEPLPDGPSQGRRVDPEAFARMRNLYYEMMGWDLETGNPGRGKLAELGLEWTI